MKYVFPFTSQSLYEATDDEGHIYDEEKIDILLYDDFKVLVPQGTLHVMCWKEDTEANGLLTKSVHKLMLMIKVSTFDQAVDY